MTSRYSRTLILSFAICLAATAAVRAQAKWVWDFEGTLGQQKIGFTLYSQQLEGLVHGKGLQCSYSYVKYLRDIPMRCNIEPDGNFTFEELDTNGNVAAIMRGKFLKNEIDNIEGVWTKTGETSSLPIKLGLEQGSSIDDGRRYQMIDAPDDAKFEAEVQEFRNAVLDGDRQKAVSFIKFPITVQVAKKAVTIRNKAAFLRNYDGIFYKDFIEDLRKTVPHDLFHRYDGAMLGSGIVWFWGDGKVFAINN